MAIPGDLDFEQIYAALFSVLTSALQAPAGPFITMSRRLRLWDQVTAAEQPALFVMETGPEVTQRSEGGHLGLAKWMLGAHLFIYNSIPDDQSVVPAIPLNNLLTAVVKSLKASPAVNRFSGGRQNLGLPGIVEHCWLEGRGIVDEGTEDKQAVIVLPVLILTADF